MDVIVDKEFKALMPKLTDSEYSGLEQSILVEGCRDALVTWNGILIDGYHRYEICQKHGVEFKTIEVQCELKDRDEVENWIINNQLGKRNLTIEWKNYLIGKKYKREKKSVGRPRGEKCRHFDDIKRTTEKIAQKHKVAPKTVERAEKFADAVDTIAKVAGEDVKESILQREIQATQKDVQELAKNPDLIEPVVEKATETKDLRKAMKLVEKERIKQARQILAESGTNLPTPDDFLLIHGDMRDKCKSINDNSIDLILTDPPYGQEYLHLWDELAVMSARVLKPSGFLITYSGSLYLDKVINALAEHLSYYWILCYKHTITQLINPRNMIAGWKPILIFQKEPVQKQKETICDFVDFDKPDKTYHDWQQGERLPAFLVEHFSNVGGTVLDCFAGSGTFVIAAYKLHRKAIAIDNDKQNINIIRGLLNELQGAR